MMAMVDMVQEDQNYEEASFQFYIRPLPLIKNEEKHIKEMLTLWNPITIQLQKQAQGDQSGTMQKQQEGDQTGTGTQGIDHVVAGTSIHVVGPDDLAFNGEIDFTTIAAVLVNGVHHEGDQIMVCGYGLQGIL
ncbi:hypothetical protein F3Y22_tig00112249pilonHSYRG00298 [Hibiscus syriacus]|uniref:Uncharacterized protein n=1 Tax=Hibiscus syriacus TaxID=106335 RepID=A0A6A2YAV5_HIBSY|nr:hypothetical protein F3Y22_tig00112249pilonHSYRG00298 [Hibiscus syriacus]